MRRRPDLSHFVGSDNIGICVKDRDGIVCYQNNRCLKACGDQNGKICEAGCMKFYRRLTDNKSPIDSRHISYEKMGDSRFDVVLLHDGQTLTTVLLDLTEKISADIDYFKQFGLTAREFQILGLVLSGLKNKEIVDQLCISRSTLKTHLNKIYAKIPKEALTSRRKAG